jgi:hypothetical protein
MCLQPIEMPTKYLQDFSSLSFSSENFNGEYRQKKFVRSIHGRGKMIEHFSGFSVE